MKTEEKDKKLIEFINSDPAVKSMAEEYFNLVTRERIGESPDITAKLDSLEEALRDRRDKLIKKEKEDGTD